MENYLILIIALWIVLGIHSAWFLIKRHTQYWDLTTREIPMLIICILIPLVTHFATLMTYSLKTPIKKSIKKPKILFKKQKD